MNTGQFLHVFDTASAGARLRPRRDRGQGGQVTGAEPPVALDDDRQPGGLGVMVMPPARQRFGTRAGGPPVARTPEVSGH